MTDFVSSIVKRLAGTQTGLRPVARSRFEPMTDNEPLLHEQVLEFDAGNTTGPAPVTAANNPGAVKPQQPDSDVTPGNTVATPAQEVAPSNEAAAVSAVSDNHEPPSGTPVAPIPPNAPVTTTLQREPVSPNDEPGKLAASVVSTKETTSKRVTEREKPTRIETPVSVGRSTKTSQATETGMSSEPSDPRRPADEPLTRLARGQAAAEHVSTRRSGFRALTTPAQPLPSAPAVPEAIAEPAQPAVRISIERLEVRVQPAKGVPVKNNHTVRPPAATDLDAFLDNLEGRR